MLAGSHSEKTMKTLSQLKFWPLHITLLAALAVAVGCATGDKPSSSESDKSAGSAQSGSSPAGSKFTATDGRVISIGSSRESEGGRSFKEPHMDKCWVADGFNFKGYDFIYVAPVTSTAKVHDDEVPIQKIAQDNLQAELKRMFEDKGFAGRVVTDESSLRPGARVLHLNNTIVAYAKGGGAARYFAGLYGAGQPKLRVEGVMTDADKTVFSYTMQRSGVSAGARMGGAAMKDEDIQTQDIHSLVLDLGDFMSAISGKYPPAP